MRRSASAMASSLRSRPARICTSRSRSKFVWASFVSNWSGERASRTVTRASFDRWRAATRPSPPLFPVPHRTRTRFPTAPNSDRSTSATAFPAASMRSPVEMPKYWAFRSRTRISSGEIIARGVGVFAVAGIAIVPLAWFLGLATEELGKHAGPGVGGLLNATFGNATEMIIAVFALGSGLTEVVKASLTGSIIGNALLVLGLSMLAGGLRHKTQLFSREASGTQVTMLVVAVIGLVMPALYVRSTVLPSQVALREMSLVIVGILLLAY